MLTYEVTLLLRNMPKNELVSVVKRAANNIFSKGGVIRRIDFLGAMKMPYKTSVHGSVFREANYFVMAFTVPPSSVKELSVEYNRDVDLIRNCIYKVTEKEDAECNLSEELKPPPYRPEVIKMLEKKKRNPFTEEFKHNSGLDYYPFQR